MPVRLDSSFTRPEMPPIHEHCQGREETVDYSCRVYVGNIAYMAQKGDIEEIFLRKGFDEISLVFSTDPFTSRNPGYCFVDLLSPLIADSAIRTLTDTLLFGRLLIIKAATPRTTFGVTNKTGEVAIRERWFPPGSLTQATSEKSAELEPCTVRISGLPTFESQHAAEVEIRMLFQGHEVQSVSKVIYLPGETDIIAFVGFKTDQEALAAASAARGKILHGNIISAVRNFGESWKKGERRRWIAQHGNE